MQEPGYELCRGVLSGLTEDSRLQIQLRQPPRPPPNLSLSFLGVHQDVHSLISQGHHEPPEWGNH